MAPPLPALYCSLLEGGQTAAAAISGGNKELQNGHKETGAMQPEPELFRTNQINDFTTEVVRGERAAVEESGALPVLGICPSRSQNILFSELEY